jgi:hypothetical protein
MKHESKRSVTVEDLLHLKRAERPPAEFWTSFERDLRAKQLAALVGKRPWWRSMPRVFAGFSRYHLPLGATAILAITFLSIREYQTVSPVRPVDHQNRAPTAPVASVAAPVADIPTSEPVRETTSGSLAAVERGVSTLPVAGATGFESARVVPVVALLDENAVGNLTPSARLIAANLAAPQELDSRFLGSARGFETRALPGRTATVEPLSQVAPSEARRSRQFAAAMPVAFNTYSGNSEKIARRISDERLYDTVSRFGARADRVNVKF